MQKGQKHSDETKAFLSEMFTGCCGTRGTTGMKHTPDSIEKMRVAKLGKKHTPDSIEKMRVAKLGKKRGPNKAK